MHQIIYGCGLAEFVDCCHRPRDGDRPMKLLKRWHGLNRRGLEKWFPETKWNFIFSVTWDCNSLVFYLYQRTTKEK